ncbi:hypothetical protein SAMN05216266_13029 [Amycolatopsis marina]|uniref:Molecular chaperone Hsp90 n=1 Tax=Amycolatopsis marina TaxID=490629 RepID=A0A1I1CJR1_9PSEU|nr:molecular chaperone Hsp90 [Amycolatopsis marina]SFB62246.1 hypothetical protein SAMN05216266_13029 [Amycolatopsis marina]
MSPSGTEGAASDPFGAAGLRAGVLRAWRESPTRFTEDTNAEHDLKVGGYRDRLFVELAQNAADAASAAGESGSLRVSVVDGELWVANTGSPLDAVGVAALSSLRASGKQGDTVGRFGVGFAAVLTVSTEPRIVSRTGGVLFSTTRTGTAAVDAGVPGADEGGEVPVLRLPWPLRADEPPPAEGYDTEVRLPLGSGVDESSLLAGFAEEAPDLLLALPWLARIEVAGAVWRRHQPASGTVEITDPTGAVRRWLTQPIAGEGGIWALPVDAEGLPTPLDGDVLHTPTPTDERLSLPARLFANVAMEPSRRRVLPGAAVTAVLRQAAQAYPELVRRVGPAARVLLVPRTGFPRSEVDEQLRELVLDALRTRPWLPPADEVAEIAAGRARVLSVDSGALVGLLAGIVPDLVAAPLCGPGVGRTLSSVGASALTSAELVEAISGIDRPLFWWRELYDALLSALDARQLSADDLGALPVPLLDGRVLPGPRGALLLEADSGLAEKLSTVDVVGLRLTHPEVAHPLLERLGATRAGITDLLEAPELRDAVQRSVEDARSGMDTMALADTVLGILSDCAFAGTKHLGALALPARSGWRRADELVLPDADLLDVLDAQALGEDGPLDVLDAEFALRWPASVLESVGVLGSFVVVADDEPVEPDHDLPDEQDWWESEADPPARVLAVRDLDLVAEDAWPATLRLLAQQPETWRALTEPRGHTGWWLARYAALAGQAPLEWRLPSAVALTGLYEPVPDLGIREDVLRAAGVRSALAVTDAEDAADLLDRLGDPGRDVRQGLAWRAHAALIAADVAVDELDPPPRVRTLAGSVADAADAVVLDAPWLLAVWPADTVVAGPAFDARLADLLDLPLASERTRATVEEAGEYVRWDELDAVRVLADLLDLPLPEGGVEMHEQLSVSLSGESHGVSWWVDDRMHAEDSSAGLGRAFAWAAGRWADRLLIVALLDEPDTATLLA